MSPIDDELRAALRARAEVLTPVPDPLAGIEARARGIRRRRRAASMTGAVLAVGAIALAVPSLIDQGAGRATPAPITTQPAPAQTLAPDPPAHAGAPVNLLDGGWQFRGAAADAPPQADVLAAFQAAAGRTGAPHFQPLYSGSKHGLRFTYGQAWYDGDEKARLLGYATGGSNGPQTFYGPDVPTDPVVLAYLIDSVPGSTTDLLVLLPREGTGQTTYAASATATPVNVAYGNSDLDNVAVVERDPMASTDRVKVVGRDGMLVEADTPVAALLCAAKECG